MNHNELHGTLALVRPDLENDHARQLGEVGVITYVDNTDKVYMSFPKGGEGIYEPADLFQLKEDDFFTTVKNDNSGSIGIKDYKDLFKIDLLQKMGRSTDILRALEIAGTNPAIWDKVLDSVDSKLAQHQVYTMTR